ncbi:MAG: hypothetical protein AAGB14_14480 [Verrucomicrobiota bacterium]
MPRIWSPLLILLFLTLSAHAETKVWNTKHGGSFEARMVSQKNGVGLFEMEGGRRFSLKLSDLAPAGASPTAAASRPIARSATSAPRTSRYGYPFPKDVRYDSRAQVRVISEDREKSVYRYESLHYHFASDVRLTSEVLRNFSVIFETTYSYCQALPLSMRKAGGSRFPVLLFGSMEAYFRAGGPPGSAGVYMPSRGLVMVPLASLGVQAGSTGMTLDRKRESRVLVHELVHQLTPTAYYAEGARGWFSEGLAEYVAASPYRRGYFQSDPHGRAVKAYVTARGLNGKMGRSLGSTVRLPKLKQFMTQPYASFSGSRANLNYGGGLLLVSYFFHLDEPNAGHHLTRFLKALDQGQSGAAALNQLRGPRSFEQLEQDIARAWRAKGVEVVFGS